jgi:F0F1-type ATP synthase assembly protein I
MSKLDPTPARPPGDNRNDESFWVLLARYSQLAFMLPAATFIGWIFGYLLDKWLHTTWLYLVGLLLGIAAGFVELIRTVTRSEQ